MARESMAHRTARRAYPEGQFAPMKWVNIKDLWYNSASHMVGIEKSAPERMPVGQRDVMVFSLV